MLAMLAVMKRALTFVGRSAPPLQAATGYIVSDVSVILYPHIHTDMGVNINNQAINVPGYISAHPYKVAGLLGYGCCHWPAGASRKVGSGCAARRLRYC